MKSIEKQLLNRAIRLLSQRALSENQLRQKLAQFFFKIQKEQLSEKIEFIEEELHETIQNVIDYCTEKSWLNDEDYIKQFIQQKIEKGFGKNRIIFELKKRELSIDNQNDYFFSSSDEILNQIQQIVNKKYPNYELNEKTKRKIWNFLNYRGFSNENIMQFFNGELID